MELFRAPPPDHQAIPKPQITLAGKGTQKGRFDVPIHIRKLSCQPDSGTFVDSPDFHGLSRVIQIEVERINHIPTVTHVALEVETAPNEESDCRFFLSEGPNTPSGDSPKKKLVLPVEQSCRAYLRRRIATKATTRHHLTIRFLAEEGELDRLSIRFVELESGAKNPPLSNTDQPTILEFCNNQWTTVPKITLS